MSNSTKPIPTRTRVHDYTPRPLAWLTPRVRAWLYGISTTLVPLLVAYGVVDQQQAPLWVALAASILATGTALVHTPGRDESVVVSEVD